MQMLLTIAAMAVALWQAWMQRDQFLHLNEICFMTMFAY